MYSTHYAAEINLRWLCSVIMSDVFSSAIWQVSLNASLGACMHNLYILRIFKGYSFILQMKACERCYLLSKMCFPGILMD